MKSYVICHEIIYHDVMCHDAICHDVISHDVICHDVICHMSWNHMSGCHMSWCYLSWRHTSWHHMSWRHILWRHMSWHHIFSWSMKLGHLVHQILASYEFWNLHKKSVTYRRTHAHTHAHALHYNIDILSYLREALKKHISRIYVVSEPCIPNLSFLRALEPPQKIGYAQTHRRTHTLSIII